MQRRYLVYKPNVLEWTEQLPASWEVTRLKDIIEVLESGVSVNATDEPVIDDKIGVLKTSCVGKNEFLPSMNKTVWDQEVTRVKVSVKGGRIIISRMNTPDLVGASAYITKDYPNLFLPDRLWQTIFYKRSRHDTKWLSYLIGSTKFRFLLSQLATGTSPSMKNLGQEKFLSIAIPFPPFFEQKEIANYLDTKATQIDQEIYLRTQKADQYEKLKQSTINETVICGLDKTVSMKGSGIEWIGKVPAHWSVSAITNVTSVISIKNHPDEELLSVYRDYGVIIKSSRDDNHNKNGANLAGYKLVMPGYLVINKMKAWQGSLGISEHKGIVSPAYITCKTNNKILERRYLHHLLRCQRYIDEYNRLSFGVRNDQWDMRYEDFKYVPVLLPPKEEQKAIADYLDEKTTKIDQIVITINQQIEKLKELRKTLINDVITGRIKVTQDDNNDGLAA